MSATRPCPDDQQLAALADGTLDPVSRAAVEAHVSECPICLDQVAALARLRATPTSPVAPALMARARDARPLSWRRWASATAAAAVLVLAVGWWNGGGRAVPPVKPAPAQSVNQDSDNERSRASTLVRLDVPKDGTVVGSSPLVRWTAPADAVSFEIQVTTPEGELVWSRQLGGSARSVTVDTALPNGAACYLWVAAYLPGGRRVASDVVKVRAAATP